MNSDLKKNRTLLIAFVIVMVVGLVAAYAPSLFSSPPLVEEPSATPETINPDQLLVPVEPTSTPTSSPSGVNVPPTQGFSGLNEENQSLKDLDSLLGQ